DLHRLLSFPTRRSSDLTGVSAFTSLAATSTLASLAGSTAGCAAALASCSLAASANNSAGSRLTNTRRLRVSTGMVRERPEPSARSEEHTSELQSRENLV